MVKIKSVRAPMADDTKYGWIYIKQTQNDNLTSDPPSALLRAGYRMLQLSRVYPLASQSLQLSSQIRAFGARRAPKLRLCLLHDHDQTSGFLAP